MEDVFSGVSRTPYGLLPAPPPGQEHSDGKGAGTDVEVDTDARIVLMEEELWILWRDVLGLDDNTQLQRHEPFSSYPGGDFVATCFLVERLRKMGYEEVSVEELLEEETVAGQARLVMKKKRKGDEE
jgi:hypothetical protein